MAKKNLKVCLGISAIYFIILSVVTIALISTVFKPKDPNIVIHLAPFDLLSQNIAPNITLPLVITMGNPNFGSFKFHNGFSYIHFHETIVGIVPIGSHLVPPRSELNVSTHANFMVNNLLQNPNFEQEIEPGMKFTIVYQKLNFLENYCQSKLKMF
ncbi:hypothetical protein P8452_12548 [Trifolium repens]|nr:hypothetical protein P8452_12548 [Trifolium repens]